MATIVSHAVCAFSLSALFPATIVNRKVLILGMALSMLPDADVAGFMLGIPYESIWGHRGITHSILFAIGCGLIFTFLFRDKILRTRLLIWVFLFLCTLSHGVLDAMTTGGLGVGFFIPFDADRYFFPWRPILVSPIGVENFFSPWGMAVIKSEIKYIWIPGLFVFLTATYLIPLSNKKTV